MHARTLGLLLVAMFAHLASASAARAEPSLHDQMQRGAVALEYENDLFAGEDRLYTNGLRVTWVPRQQSVPDWLRAGARLMPLFQGTGDVTTGYALGQNMYTPEDISDPDPPPDVRPYAGWLYLNAGLTEERNDRLDQLTLGIGIVGPASLADRTQREIHRHYGNDRPEGWDTQLRNELTVQAGYEREWRNHASYYGDNLGTDVIPHAGGAVGNAFTYLNTGLTLRFGRRLPQDFGPPRITPARSGTALFTPRGRHGWYLFAGVEGRLMLRDITLDGNTFRDSRSVSREHLVGETQFGLVFYYGDVRVSYTHVIRTREFEEQSAARTEFGAMSLTWLL